MDNLYTIELPNINIQHENDVNGKFITRIFRLLQKMEGDEVIVFSSRLELKSRLLTFILTVGDNSDDLIIENCFCRKDGNFNEIYIIIDGKKDYAYELKDFCLNAFLRYRRKEIFNGMKFVEIMDDRTNFFLFRGVLINIFHEPLSELDIPENNKLKILYLRDIG